MQDSAFDQTLIASAFALAAEAGWNRVTVADAARRADLPLPDARRRFPGTAAILLRFGQMADAAALDGATDEGPLKDRLFDIVMRRIDVLQAHRDGVLALFQALPAHPATALMLLDATRRSMGWLLDAAGAGSGGPGGGLRVAGLEAVWLWTVRAWTRDDTADLGPTMAALDAALERAGNLARWLPGGVASDAAASAEAPAPALLEGTSIGDTRPEAKTGGDPLGGLQGQD